MAPLSSSSSKIHIIIFPFMSKGHTIPLLHLSRLLLRRGIKVTVFTTAASHHFISQFFAGDDDGDVSVIDLPFPENIDGIPPGIESTDKLPSMSLFIPFVTAIKGIQAPFEEALRNIHSEVTCIVSDGFLTWTQQSATRFGIPRLCFYGMGHYSGSMFHAVMADGLLWSQDSADEPFTSLSFPWIKLTRNDFSEPLDKCDLRGPHFDFMMEAAAATASSFGLVVNSFHELEQPFKDYWNRECQPKAWSIGPLCLAAGLSNPSLPPSQSPKWLDWLDQKLAQGSRVLYIAFGSQAKLSPPQLQQITLALEETQITFLWVIKTTESDSITSKNFKEKINERGLIVNEWVDQKQILEHPAVEGFLSHCGWNSVLEGICAEVPILAWPLMAEQFLNAKFVAEEIRVGLRVETVDGSTKGFVTAERLKSAVVELMEGEKGRGVREKVKKVAATARNAVAEGGSSWIALEELVGEVCRQREINSSELN